MAERRQRRAGAAPVSWLALGVVWFVTLIPFLALRRYVDRRLGPVWTRVLDGQAARHFDYLRLVFEGEAELVAEGVDLAAAHLARGQRETAQRHLAGALADLRRSSAEAQARLGEWHQACRAALSLLPVLPLRTVTFRLRTLRGLAAMHRLAHLVLVTSGERFRLRLRLLDYAFGALTRAVAHTHGRLERELEALDEPDTWTRARDLVHDFQTLTRESLDTARALLAAAQSIRSGEAARDHQEPE